jgi:hypothetical protein
MFNRLTHVCHETGAAFFRPIRESFRLDPPFAVLLGLTALCLAPCIPKLASDVQSLCYGWKDEPAMTMALESMTVWPYGNTANYWNRPAKRPAYWQYTNYSYWCYAQGIYYDLAFLAFAPLKWLGVPTFPTAPIILRSVSLGFALLGLMLLYNLAKQYSGRLTAIFAVLIWTTSFWIIGNAVSVHPDSTQIALSFLALHLAIRHQRDGDLGSLQALGLACGLQHSAKMGGFWLIPMALIAMAWGWRRACPERPCRALALRIGLLLFFAVIGFFLASPYALKDPAYWQSVLSAQAAAQTGHTVTSALWLAEIWDNQGAFIVVASILALAWHLGHLLIGRANPPVTLAAILALSNLAWFIGLGNEIRIEWVTPAFPLFGLVLGDFVSGMARHVARFPGAKTVTRIGVVVVVAFVIFDRWYFFTEPVLIHLSKKSPVPRLTEKMQEFAPAGSRILSDRSGIVLFDTRIYPEQACIGTVGHFHLWLVEPHYLVLSHSYLDVPLYANLCRHQGLSVFSSQDFSVRLYQDLFLKSGDGPRLGATAVPGIELVGFIPDWTTPLPAPMLPPRIQQLAPRFCRQVETTRSQINVLLFGHCNTEGGCQSAYWVYRLHPAGASNGRMTPISSGDARTCKAAYAFDDNASVWQSNDRGAEVADRAFIGFDFGGGSQVAVRKVGVRWSGAQHTPETVKLQFSDDGRQWADAGSFQTELSSKVQPVPEQILTVPQVGPHRAWRILATAPLASEVPFAVVDVRFLDEAGNLVW